MYDLPHLHHHTDALWGDIRRALQGRGINAPQELTRTDDLERAWHSKELLLGQTCGLPYVTDLRNKVSLLGAPIYDFPHCGQGTYASLIIVPKDSDITALPDFIGQTDTIFAINSFMSQSGYAAMMHDWHAENLPFPTKSDFLITGTHLGAIEAVATGKADIAAIDSITWGLAISHVPHCAHVKIIAITDQTPGLPLITAHHTQAQALRECLTKVFESYSGPLKIKGLQPFSESDYDQIKARNDRLPKF